MPTYDYICPNGHRFEVVHSVTAEGPTACPICGASPVRKAFAPPTIHFKGSGWAKKDRGAAARSKARDGVTAGSGSDGGGSESGGSDGGGADKQTAASGDSSTKSGDSSKDRSSSASDSSSSKGGHSSRGDRGSSGDGRSGSTGGSSGGAGSSSGGSSTPAD